MLTSRRTLGDRGMTFVEMVVVLAVVAAVAAVLAPEVIGRLGKSRTAVLASDLRALSRAALEFRGDVGRYPKRISYLGAPIRSGSRDSCNGLIPDSATWRGPYLAQTVTPGGLVRGTAVIQDTVQRAPATPAGNAYGTWLLVVTGVEQEVADELEAAFDGPPANPADGVIRYTAAGSGAGTLHYAMPIRGC